MEFNKVKRILEKSMAIFSVVFYAICIFISLELISSSIYYLTQVTYLGRNYNSETFNYEYMYGYNYRKGYTYLIIGLLLLTFSSICLIISANLIKSPLKNGETVVDYTRLRITLLVFSFLTCNIVTAGLIIAVLCLKDFSIIKQSTQNCKIENSPQNQISNNKFTSIDEKITQIKELLNLGIIDNETYKKAVAKLIKDSSKN